MMKLLIVLLLFAVANGAPGVVYPQHLVYNPWFGTYPQPIPYYYYYPQSRNVQKTVSERWWQSCSGPVTGPDGYQCCLQDEGDCDSDSDCCEGLYCEQSWGNDYCTPKSVVSELPIPTEAPQVNFPTETQQPGYNISNIMEWPYENKEGYLSYMEGAIPGLKNSVQMDPLLRFDTFMRKGLSLSDTDGNGKLSADEMFKSQTGPEQETIKEIREKIKRFDTNGDHQLSVEEAKPSVTEELNEDFAELDLNGDHIISLTELAESELGDVGYDVLMGMVFTVESWLPESEQNTASDWLALDHKEFEAFVVSMGLSFPTKLTMQAAQNAMQYKWQGLLSNIAGLL